MKPLLIFLLLSCLFSPALAEQDNPAIRAYQLADSLYREAEFRAALAPAEEAITGFEAQENWPRCFDAQLLHHLLLRNVYKKKSSRRALESAYKTHQQFLDSSYRQAELYTYLSADYINQKTKRQKGQQFLEQALDLIVNTQPIDSALLAQVYLNYAILSTGQTDQTISYYNRGLAVINKAQLAVPRIEGQILRGLGNVNRFQSDFEQALQYYQQEAAAYARHYPSDHFDIAAAHYNIANVYYELLEYQKALDHYHLAYPGWSKRWKPEDRYMRYMNEAMGDLYFELGKNKEALLYFDRSIVGEKQVDQDSSLLLTNEAQISNSKGQYDLALSYYQQALDFRKKHLGIIHPLTGACNNYIARVYKSQGKLDIALQNYQHSLIMMTNEFSDSSIYSNPTIEHIINPDYYLLESIIAKGELLIEKYQRDNTLKDLEAAFQSLQFGIQLIDLIRRSPISEASKLTWTQKAFPSYELAIRTGLQLAAIHNDEDYLQHCFAIAEKSKAFLLLSALQGKKIRDFGILPEDLQEEERRIQSQIRHYSGKILIEEKRCSAIRPKKLKVWQQELFSLQTEYDEFLNQLQSQQANYYQLKYDISTSTIPALQQELLSDQQALLEFFEGEKEGFLFVITRQDIQYYTYPKDSILDHQIANIRQWLNHHNVEDDAQLAFQHYQDAASGLYEQVLKTPLAALDSKIQSLIIIPDGQLSYLPFECLLTSTQAQVNRNYRQLPYLLRRYAISYGQSATLAHRSQTTAQVNRPKYPLLGFAPQYHSAVNSDAAMLTPLRFNARELDIASQHFEGEQYLAAKATKANFKQLASEADILHLALHATVADEDPLLSSLYFSATDTSDGQLYAYELYDIPLNARLAILSACNTGTGQWIRGEGMMSLARCFQYAGCPSLLTSLWTVDDHSTAALMGHFYAELKDNSNKDIALQKAKLQYLDTADPANAHPFYWAAFTLQGNSKAIDFQDNSGRWWYLFPLLLLLGGMGYFLKRKQH